VYGSIVMQESPLRVLQIIVEHGTAQSTYPVPDLHHVHTQPMPLRSQSYDPDGITSPKNLSLTVCLPRLINK
jgi:hypothetical protein